MLRPDDHSHRFLLSSPVRFVGEFESDELLIAHAWPDFLGSGPMNMMDSPPYFFVVAVKSEPEPGTDGTTGSREMPSYHWYGERIAVCLSIFFGKRFDHLGALETHGMFSMPTRFPVYRMGGQPRTEDQIPRANFGGPLNLHRIEQIARVLHLAGDSDAITRFDTAGLFYNRSIAIVREQPELAYIDLVSAGELLAGQFPFSDDELLDDPIKEALRSIQQHIPNGEQVKRIIRKRMHQIKRGYTLAIMTLLSEAFFESADAHHAALGLRREVIKQTIKASYDLRSQYVHTGRRFGLWTGLGSGMEIIPPNLVLDDEEFAKTLGRSPSYLGLERVIRYCLLRFAHLFISPIDACLDGQGIEK